MFVGRCSGVCLTALVMGCAGGSPSGLMSFEEYAALDHSVPYVLWLDHPGGGELLYYGSRHTFDPRDAQVEEIAALWKQFEPTLAFYEGGGPFERRENREEAVRRSGEPGLVQYLASQSGIEALSPEPDPADEVQLLRGRYSAAQIKLFYALRQVSQYLGYEGRELAVSLEAKVLQDLEAIGHYPGLEGPPRDLEELDRLCREYLPALSSWRDVTISYFDPVPDSRPRYTNSVSRELSELRDRHIIDRVLEEVRSGERLFAVIGASHVVMQERALERALAAR